MIRIYCEYTGPRTGSPIVQIEATTTEDCLDSMKKYWGERLRRFAWKDWEYTSETVRARRTRGLATVTAR